MNGKSVGPMQHVLVEAFGELDAAGKIFFDMHNIPCACVSQLLTGLLFGTTAAPEAMFWVLCSAVQRPQWAFQRGFAVAV